MFQTCIHFPSKLFKYSNWYAVHYLTVLEDFFKNVHCFMNCLTENCHVKQESAFEICGPDQACEKLTICEGC